MAVALARLGAPAGEQDALGRSLPEWDPFPEVPAALEEARDARLAAGGPLEHRPGPPRGVARPDRRRVRPDRRRVRDRLVQARAGHWDEFFARSGRRPREPRPRRRQPLPRHRARLRARPAYDLDQPARRGGRARPPSSCGPGRPRRHPRLARAGMNVRPVTPDDFPALRCLSRRRRDATSSAGPPGWRARMSRPGSQARISRTTVAVRGGETARRTSAGSRTHDDTGIAVGVVHRERRGRGLGSTLVDRSEERLRALGAARIHNVDPCPGHAAPPLFESPRLPRGAPLLGHDDRARRRSAARSAAPGRLSDRAVLPGSRARVPRRARGGVRRALGVRAATVRGVVGAAGRDGRITTPHSGSWCVPTRTSWPPPVNDPERSRRRLDRGHRRSSGVARTRVWRRRCCCTASASSIGAGSVGSGSASTPRTQPVRRGSTRASA